MTRKSLIFMITLVLQLTWLCQSQTGKDERLMTLSEMYENITGTSCYINHVYPCVQYYYKPATLGQFCLIILEQKSCLLNALKNINCTAEGIIYEPFRDLACGSSEAECRCLL